MEELTQAEKEAIARYWKDKPYVSRYGDITGCINLVVHPKNEYYRREASYLWDNSRPDIPESGAGFTLFAPGEHERAIQYYTQLWGGQLSIFN